MAEAVTDADKRGDSAAQVQQGVQFDGCFCFTKRRLWKHRQAQVNSGGVERVDGVLQIDTEGVVGVKPACNANQALCKVDVDAPVTRGICIGERVARRPCRETGQDRRRI